MNPIITSEGYKLDQSGNYEKWKTEKQLLKQRLHNALRMRRGAFVIQGYEDGGSLLHTIYRQLPSQRQTSAVQWANDALQPFIDDGEIIEVSNVNLNEVDRGRWIVFVSVRLPDGDILDLEVTQTYGNL